MGIIFNAGDQPLFSKSGTVPDVSGALQGYYQSMTFTPLVKTVSGYQVVETQAPIVFRGTWQPFKPRELELKPEGQRAWSWFWVHSDPALVLKDDDIVLYNNVPSRVMAKQDCSIYGYVAYQIVQDWTDV